MADTGLSDEVARFVAEHIDSVYQLEVLLLLQRTAPREWNAVQLAAELRTNPPVVESTLEDLRRRGLLISTEGIALTYSYRPAVAAVDSAVRALARAYAQRHFAVIGLIFSEKPEPHGRGSR